MNLAPFWQVILGTLCAGLAMPAGALLARYERLGSDWLEAEFRHSVIAFGGGALLSAVALVLVPQGIEHLEHFGAAASFFSGAVAFLGLDLALARHDTPASQLAAMLSDFLPESLALGASFASGGPEGVLLAALMTLQNGPEGFNAYRELADAKSTSSTRTLVVFAGLALLGPLFGTVGYFWLADSPKVLAVIMLGASGGILYSVFQDIAPQARLERHWAPPLGAVLGFILGLVGHMLTSS